MAILTDFFSEKQLDSFRNSNSKINIWEGSVSAGKTYISLWRFYKECSKGPDGQFVIISKTYDTFKRNVLPELEKIIGHNYVRYYAGKREVYIKNRLVHVVGADDATAEYKIRGPTFAGAYVDEITLIPEGVFNMLLSRLRVPGAKLFGTTNPDSPFHWLKTRFLDNNPDVTSFKFLMDDNPHLETDYKDFIKRQYQGLWYQRFIEGLWVQAEGAVYDQFSADHHVIDYPSHAGIEYYVGVDYGTTNPCAFVLVGYNPHYFPNLWVEKEYYYSSKVQQRQKTDAEYSEDLQNFIQGRNVKALYIDPSAASFKAELLKSGISNLFDAQNEVEDGIRKVSTYLTTGTLKICRCCSNLIQEFQSYVWDPKAQEKGIDKPLKENDHALDALRYVIYTKFFGKDSSRLSASELDRLYNETRSQGTQLPPFFQQPHERAYW